ncbi:hypothetical protein SUGI_0553390 [Cryptomeria japonica]|nr:hypothetical protein SUGI_0553390 [Cryptomeria japonica]
MITTLVQLLVVLLLALDCVSCNGLQDDVSCSQLIADVSDLINPVGSNCCQTVGIVKEILLGYEQKLVGLPLFFNGNGSMPEKMSINSRPDILQLLSEGSEMTSTPLSLEVSLEAKPG